MFLKHKHLYNNLILTVNDEGRHVLCCFDVRSDKPELWNDNRISDLASLTTVQIIFNDSELVFSQILRCLERISLSRSAMFLVYIYCFASGIVWSQKSQLGNSNLQCCLERGINYKIKWWGDKIQKRKLRWREWRDDTLKKLTGSWQQAGLTRLMQSRCGG